MINTKQLYINGGGRNNLLDTVKGICILFVIFTHYGWSDYQWKKMLFPFWIDMAVPMFMIISGYVFSLSFNKHQITSLADAYSYKNIVPRILRFTIPFVIAYIVELIGLFILDKSKIEITRVISCFITGGYGPGSYYYPVMIQFLFIFPVIYFIVKKYSYSGFLCCFGINIVYEVLHIFYGITEVTYRLLVFRYISVISFGCYKYLYPNLQIKKIWKLISFMVGFLFIILTAYTNYKPVIINYWTRTSFLATLYLLPICDSIFKLKVKKTIMPLTILGKASFNIFLTQMVYFTFLSSTIYESVNNIVLRNMINICICGFLGIKFYLIENNITLLIVSKTNHKLFGIQKITELFIRE